MGVYTLKGVEKIFWPPATKKRVGGPVVEGGIVGAGLVGVLGVGGGGTASSSMGVSGTGVLEQRAAAAALARVDLPALVMASLCDLVFGTPCIGRRGHSMLSAAWGPLQCRHLAGHVWGFLVVQLVEWFPSRWLFEPHRRHRCGLVQLRELCHK